MLILSASRQERFRRQESAVIQSGGLRPPRVERVCVCVCVCVRPIV